ncbi:DUF3570 domain-containing protein [Marinobacter sp.]|jgi:hypothetical protein|uniref:DUF3570 domain-containing protein n=1 Tax=Marinobacter sp. TaxID=50741 RepID=UPI0019B4B034|nr:DUF3570 domain-containing protein [Marinobacter sp.]MBC7193398.1 DUF3570 domain-containing protein [Marinobacter sp.]
MQLISEGSENQKPDRCRTGAALAAATLSLLGTTDAMAREQPGEWDVNTAILFYSETDDRVQAVEPVISATRYFEDGRSLNLKAVADTLTGASPNGATPSDEVQTFTKPSGNGSYEIQPSEQPLDDTFQDTRGTFSATWSAPINRKYDYSVGGYFSKEYDYTSMALNGSVSRYLNNKNTTLNLGTSLSLDTITPEGDIPIGLSTMPVPANISDSDFDQAFDASRDSSDDTKTVVDLLLGVTQVIDSRTVMQVNYSLSMSDGYLTDPFKILSVIDDRPGSNYGGNLKDGDGNNIYLYEQRPDSRMKHALYWQTKHMLENGDVVDGSYRFMVDDWGISSHTFDVRYRWMLGNQYLEPHLRYYMQSEADFYKRYLTGSEYNGGAPRLSEASADYRVGDLDGITVGLKWGYRFDEDHEFSIRAEYMQQSNSGDSGFGKLASQELYPDTDAFWLQVGYSF